MTQTSDWTVETLYHKGDPYFSAIGDAINRAEHSVDIEMYMYCNDGVGRKIAERLINAAKRGVTVRVIVDGVGSLGWINSFGHSFDEAEIAFKVYHQMFWERFHSKKHPQATIPGFLKLIGQSNKRDHRKLVVIDEKTVFIGSRNFSAAHSEKIEGDHAWRDVSVKVEGEPVADLVYAFNRSWVTTPPKRQWKKMLWQRRKAFSPLVRLNVSRKLRKKNIADLVSRIENAEKRIWIMTGYFIPSPPFLNALMEAARKGIDVRILLPLRSDVFFMPWVASLLYPQLLQAAIKIYQYKPAIFHAKAMLIDDWVTLGSNNLNHRSLVHDLEADVVLVTAASRESMAQQFTEDIREAEEVTDGVLKRGGPLRYFVGRFASLFKYWM